MTVPIYAELTNGRVIRFAEVKMVGNNTLEQSVPLGQVKEAPKRAMINYYYDVLALDK